MAKNLKAKKVRAVIVTMALVGITNFTIARAETTMASETIKAKTGIVFTSETSLPQLAADGTLPVPAPRPNTSLAADGTLPVPAPRPNTSLAADGTLPVPAPRPNTSLAADGTLPVPAPRPSFS